MSQPELKFFALKININERALPAALMHLISIIYSYFPNIIFYFCIVYIETRIYIN